MPRHQRARLVGGGGVAKQEQQASLAAGREFRRRAPAPRKDRPGLDLARQRAPAATDRGHSTEPPWPMNSRRSAVTDWVRGRLPGRRRGRRSRGCRDCGAAARRFRRPSPERSPARDSCAIVAEHPFGIGVDASAAPRPVPNCVMREPRHLHRIAGVDELRQLERQRAAPRREGGDSLAVPGLVDRRRDRARPPRTARTSAAGLIDRRRTLRRAGWSPGRSTMASAGNRGCCGSR